MTLFRTKREAQFGMIRTRLHKEERNRLAGQTSEFEEVADLMPRLFLVTERLLDAPKTVRHHNSQQYCRYAIRSGPEPTDVIKQNGTAPS